MKAYVIEYNNKILGVYDNYNQLELFLNSSIQNNFINSDNLYIVSFNTNSCHLLEKKIYKYIFNNNSNELSTNDTTYVTNTTNTDTNANANTDTTDATTTDATTTDTTNTNDTNDANDANDANTDANTDANDANTDTITYTPNNEMIFQEQKVKMSLLSEEKKELLHKINLLKNQQEILKNLHSEYEYDLQLYNLFNKKQNEDSNFIIPELFRIKYDIMKTLEHENKLSWNYFYDKYSKIKGENNYDLFNDNCYNDKF